MIYYSNEARQSAIASIDDLMEKIGSIPGDKLNYLDAHAVIKYLAQYQSLIKKELREQNKKAE